MVRRGALLAVLVWLLAGEMIVICASAANAGLTADQVLYPQAGCRCCIFDYSKTRVVLMDAAAFREASAFACTNKNKVVRVGARKFVQTF